jgi:hypothetical protein
MITHKKDNTILNPISSIIIIFLVVIFYLFCYQFSYNFFYQDDYHLLRYVTLTQDHSLGFSEKLKALWDLHNEHRIIFPRLIVLLDYYIQGHIDWQVLNTIAALYYLGIFYFFYIIIKKMLLPVWYAIPVALFIFQPASYENFYWTISILQQVGNIFWAMLLFYSIVYFPPKYFWISIVIAIILTFTHGNGLFAFAIGGFLFFLQKRYIALGIWLLVMTTTAILYFWGYYTAQNSNIMGSLSNPLQLIGCFGGFWGNFIREYFRKIPPIEIIISTGLFIFFCLSILNLRFLILLFTSGKDTDKNYKISKEQLFTFSLFAFFVITSALVSLSRSWSSIEAGIQNRYLHNSVIVFLILYLSILLLKSKKTSELTGVLFLILGVFFYVFSWYSNFEFLRFQKNAQETDAVNYEVNGISIVNDKSFNHNIETVLKQSFENGISVFPENSLRIAIKNLDKVTTNSDANLPILIRKDSTLTFNIANSRYRNVYNFQNLNLHFTGDVYITFKSDKNVFVCGTSHLKNSKKNFLTTGMFFTNGFFTTVMTDAMPANNYTIGILQKNNNQFIYYPTKYKILIQ